MSHVCNGLTYKVYIFMCFLIVLCAKLLFHSMDVIRCFDAVPQWHPPWNKPDPFVTVPISLIAIGSLQEQVLEENRRNRLTPRFTWKTVIKQELSRCWDGRPWPPFPSNRHHRSNGDCLEGKRENYQVCYVQYCVQQLYTVNCTHI